MQGKSHLLLKHILISKTVLSPLPLLGGPGGTPPTGSCAATAPAMAPQYPTQGPLGGPGGCSPFLGLHSQFQYGQSSWRPRPQDDCPTKLNLVKNPIKNQPTSALSSTAGWEIFIYDNLHQGGGRQVDSKTPNLHKNLKRNLFLFYIWFLIFLTKHLFFINRNLYS